MAISSSIKSAPARLRRTFQYPTDDSSTNDSPDVMDEEEQESLISSLAAQDARRNAHFRGVLFALPVLAAVPYLIELFVRSARGSSGGGDGSSDSQQQQQQQQQRPPALFSLLALTSLASTAYLLWKLPPTQTGIAVLDAWNNSSSDENSSRRDNITGGNSKEGEGRGGRGAFSRNGGYAGTDDMDNNYYHGDDDDNDDTALAGPSSGGGGGRPPRGPRKPSSIGISGAGSQHQHHQLQQQAYRSPLEVWLPYLNAALCLLVVLMGLVGSSSSSSSSGSGDDENAGGADGTTWGRGVFIGLGNLPAAVFAVVLLAKTVMASVDPERELSGLRYGYKGA